ncbi:MAG: cupin domain-containing protein [Acidobacteria bacterium]|nr:cupin domain-containing protein [Acidobacteriota bacterium]
MKFSANDQLARLPLPPTGKWKEGVWDVEAFARGDLSLLFFAPKGKDYQSPHDQDELYLVIRGTGTLRIGEVYHPFEPGDVLFVAAGEDHRFEEFSDDFACWAVFWGPKLREGDLAR